MSIHPDFSKARRDWQQAAFEIPVPDDLTQQDDRQEWRVYMQVLPPGQLLTKFREALNQLHEGWRSLKPDSGDAEKIRIYSKWEAAQIASQRVSGLLRFASKPGTGNDYDSDMSVVLSYVPPFLESVRSDDLKIWQDIIKCHSDLDQDRAFDQFITDAHKWYVNRPPSPPPNGPSGPA